jgi:hypothetical protein
LLDTSTVAESATSVEGDRGGNGCAGDGDGGASGGAGFAPAGVFVGAESDMAAAVESSTCQFLSVTADLYVSNDERSRRQPEELLMPSLLSTL